MTRGYEMTHDSNAEAIRQEANKRREENDLRRFSSETKLKNARPLDKENAKSEKKNRDEPSTRSQYELEDEQEQKSDKPEREQEKHNKKEEIIARKTRAQRWDVRQLQQWRSRRQQ